MKTKRSDFFKAEPIWLKGNLSEKNLRVIFQTKIGLTEGSEIHIATSCVYKLYVDGKFISYGPARAGRNVFRKDVISIGKYARIQESFITIEVQSYQVNSFYVMHQTPFLQAEILSEGEVSSYTGDEKFKLCVDDTLVRKVQRFSFQRPFVEAYRMQESSHAYRITGLCDNMQFTVLPKRVIVERVAPYPQYACIDANMYAEGKAFRLEKPAYIDSRSYVGICEKLKGFLPEELEWHISREVQDYTFQNADLKNGNKLSAEEYRIYEFPYNVTGFAGVDLAVCQDAEVYIIFDEVLLDNDILITRDECCRAVKYELKKGTYSLQLFEVYGMKYLKIFVKSGCCEINNVQLTTYTHQPVDYQYMKTNKNDECLIEAAIHTFCANAVDLFTDCPTRERGGYPCDSLFTGRTEFLLTGNNLVENCFLENFLHEDTYQCIAEGMVPMCYPADHLDGVYIPNWGLWLILELEEYATRTSDYGMVEAYRDKVMGIIDFHRKLENEEHLLAYVPEGVFVEWSHANAMVQDINYPSNMLYYATLKAVSRLYGDPFYAEHAENVKESVIRYSYNGKFFCDHAKIKDGKICTVDESSEICQYYAFCFGIADEESFSDLFQTLLRDFTEQRHASNPYPDICFAEFFIGVPLRMEMLLKYNRYEDAYREIVAYYLPGAQLTGTLWERRQLASCNHGFSSIVAYWLDEIENKRVYQVLH